MASVAEFEIGSWRKIAIEWVNCLELTDPPITNLKELTDGRFFQKVFRILFQKSAQTHDVSTIFGTLEQCLRGYYAPSDWIDFRQAQNGDEFEIFKAVIVLIGMSVFQSKQDTEIFRVNPAEKLSQSTQVSIRSFLLAVQTNNRIVIADCLTEEANENKRFKRGAVQGQVDRGSKHMAGRVLFAKKVPLPHRQSLELQYTSSISEVSSPLGELFKRSNNESSDQQLLTEKENETTRLRQKLEVLTSLQEDSQEELTKYKIEVNTLRSSLNESNKAFRRLQDQVDFQKYNDVSKAEISATDEITNYQLKVSGLSNRLKKEEKRVDTLENENFELKRSIEEHDVDKAKQQNKIKELTVEIQSLREELTSTADEKGLILEKMKLKNEQIQDLERNREEMDEIINSIRNRTSPIVLQPATPACVQYRHRRSSASEDLGHAVIEVQLKEAKCESDKLREMLDDLQNEFSKLAQQLEDANRRADEEARERATLVDKIRNVERDLDRLRVQLDEESEAKADLQEQLSKATGEAQLWRAKYESEGIARAKELEEFKRKLQHELERTQSLAAQIEKERNYSDKSIAEWKTKADDLAAELDASQKECRNYSTELFRLNAVFEESQEQLDAVRCAKQKLNDELESKMELYEAKLQQQLEEHERRVQDMEISAAGDLKRVQQLADNAILEKSLLENKFAQEARERATLVDKIRNMERDLDGLRVQLDEKSEAKVDLQRQLSKSIAEWKTKADDLAAELDASQKECRNYSTELLRLNAFFEESQEQLDAVRCAKQKLDDELEAKMELYESKLQQREAEHESQVQEIEARAAVDLKRMQQLADNANLEKSLLENKFAQEARERATLVDQIHNVERDLDGLRVQLDEESEAKADLQEQLSKATGEAQLWRAKYESEGIARAEELEESKRKLQHELERTQSLAAQIEKERNYSDKSIAEWKTKADDLAAELDASQKECRNYSTELFRLNAVFEESQEQLDAVRCAKQKLDDELEAKMELYESKLQQREAEHENQVQEIEARAAVDLKRIQQLADNANLEKSLLENKFAQEARERATLVDKIHNVERDLDGLRVQLDEESEAKADLQEQLSKATGETQLWRAKYESEGIARAKELEESKRKLHLEHERTQSLAAQIEKDRNYFDKSIAEWKIKADDIAAELDASQKECRNYSTELFRLKAVFEESQEQLSAVRCAKQKLNDELESKMELYESKLQEREAEHESRVQEVEARAAGDLKRVHQLADNAILEKSLLENKFAQEAQKLVQDAVTTKAKLEDLQKELEDERSAKHKAEGDLKVIQETVNDLKRQVQDMETSAAEDLKRTQQLADSAVFEKSLLENKFAQEAQKLVQDAVTTKAKLEDLQKELEDERSAKHKAEGDLKVTQETVNDLKRQVQDMDISAAEDLKRTQQLADSAVFEKSLLEKKFAQEAQKLVQDAVTRTKSDVQTRYTERFEKMKLDIIALAEDSSKKKDAEIAGLNLTVDNLTKDRALLRAGQVELNHIIYKLKEEVESLKRKCADVPRSIQNHNLPNISYPLPAQPQRIRLPGPPPPAPDFGSSNDLQLSRLLDSNLERSVSNVSLASLASNTSTGSRSKAVPQGSGTFFDCEDEYGFEFSEKNLASLKGEVATTINDVDRVQEIQRRNTLLPPHMRSCYPGEYQFLGPNIQVDEENIRVPDVCLPDTFKNPNQSLSQSQLQQQQRRRATFAHPFTELTNRQYQRK